MQKRILLLLSLSIHLITSSQNMKSKKIVWQSSFINTTEFVSIKPGNDFTVKGNITGEAKGTPVNVQYELQIDNNWTIQSVLIKVESDSLFTLFFKKDKQGNWLDANGKSLTDLNGCIDIDISLTPFTNTLPIKRLRLAEGKSEEIKVAYFNLPKPEFKPVRQRYTNLGNNFYKYENLESGFTAVIETDNDGIVINYPGIWHRVYPGK